MCMASFLVLYYSRTGNTEKMAKAVAEGARTVQGVEVETAYYMAVEALTSFDALTFGVPTYHHDMPLNIKNLLEEVAVKKIVLKGKNWSCLRLLWLERRSSSFGS